MRDDQRQDARVHVVAIGEQGGNDRRLARIPPVGEVDRGLY
ncbi:hypothetical protein [Stieleria neptunia]|nr:hypothetical protein [Stieleria neptunia]